MTTFRLTAPGSLPSIWYSRNDIWSIWFVSYMNLNQLYSIYSNLGVYTGSRQASLVINRMEPGLHLRKKLVVDTSRLLIEWKDEYVVFPTETVRLNWDGSYIPRDRQY